MHDQEGVIKYLLHHTNKPISKQIPLDEINAWRNIFMRLELIGQNSNRYNGLGYGNISQKLSLTNNHFIISGTQTGHRHKLNHQHYAVVETAYPDLNQLSSYGNSKPSSEALTHAIIYQQHKNIYAVIHVHCPEIWKYTEQLNIPHTGKHITYGTPTMATAVEQLFTQGRLNQLHLFTMLGHEDGVISFGNTLSQAAIVLIEQLSKAIAIAQPQ